jgi:perosamine synthetase
MINIYEPNLKKYTSSAIDAIESGWISNHGKYIDLATNKLSTILNSKYCILMANGTCATHCLFLSIKYKYPDINKIYVPNNCYVAAWNCVLMEYNIENIEVMKMDLNTWNINTSEEYIKQLDSNSVVLIVHNLGNIINVPRLKKIRPDIIFVEDNCEGLFGKYESIYAGTGECSLCSSLSFYGNKIITTGEGGAFLTNDIEVYEYVKKVYSQGMSEIRYLHDIHAYNYRMTNIQAAFLYDQLNDIDNILDTKQNVFNYYTKNFKNIKQIKLFEKEKNTESANWIYSIRIENKLHNFSILDTYQYFKLLNIDIRPFFYPIDSHKHLSLENNDETSHILNNEIIMIPSSPLITKNQQDLVIKAVYDLILLNKNIKAIKIDRFNIDLLKQFISEINCPYFRYFNKRHIDCINYHLVTYLFYDTEKNIYFGYSHIDYESKYWFGIYINSDFRNKGFGNIILNYTLKLIDMDNVREIYLSVDDDNINAQKLYIKNDFVLIEQKSNIKIMKKIF